MYSDILLATKTRDQQNILLSEINLLREALYSADEREFQSVLQKKVRQNVSSLILKDLADPSLDKKSYLENLVLELGKRQTLKLTLSFEPTESFAAKIFDFARLQANMEIVLDFDLDPSILAGAVLYFKGKYFNYTLDKIFKNLEPQIQELIWKNLKNT